MIKHLDEFHGVETLEDLILPTDSVLRDIGASVLHRRRFHRAIQALPQSEETVNLARLRCSDHVQVALNVSRLERFSHRLRARLGVRKIINLLELRRADLIAVGLPTLQRHRFYELLQVLRPLPGCTKVSRSGAGYEHRLKLRQRLRLQHAEMIWRIVGQRKPRGNSQFPLTSRAQLFSREGHSVGSSMGV